MKSHFLPLLIATCCLSALPSSGQAPYSPDTVAVLLNYCKVSLTKIVDNADKVVLDDEYDAIISNIDVTRVKDDEMCSLFNDMLKCLNEKRLRDEERQQVRELFEQQIKDAIYESFSSPGSVFASGGTPLGIAASSVHSVISGYCNYKRTVARYKTEMKKELWQLNKDDLRDLTFMRQQFFMAEYRLYKRYNLPDRLRLTEKQVTTLSETLSMTNLDRRIRLLEGYKSDFEAYPAYWFYIGHSYQELTNTPKALKYYSHFDKVFVPILREDGISALVSLNRVQLLDPAHDKTQIRADLRNIERNNVYYYKWEQILSAALSHARIGEYEPAKELLQRNIDHNCAVANQYKLIADINSELALKELPSALRHVLSDSKGGFLDALATLKPRDEYTFLRAARPLITSVHLDIKSQLIYKGQTTVVVPARLVQANDGTERPNVVALRNGKTTAQPSSSRTRVESCGATNEVYTFDGALKPSKNGSEVTVQIGFGGSRFDLIYALHPPPPKSVWQRFKRWQLCSLASAPFEGITSGYLPMVLYASLSDSDSVLVVLRGVRLGNTQYKFVNGDLAP